MHTYRVLIASEILAHKRLAKRDGLFSPVRQLTPPQKRLQLLALRLNGLSLLLKPIAVQKHILVNLRGKRAIRAFNGKLIIDVVCPQYVLEFVVIINLAYCF